MELDGRILVGLIATIWIIGITCMLIDFFIISKQIVSGIHNEIIDNISNNDADFLLSEEYSNSLSDQEPFIQDANSIEDSESNANLDLPEIDYNIPDIFDEDDSNEFIVQPSGKPLEIDLEIKTLDKTKNLDDNDLIINDLELDFDD